MDSISKILVPQENVNDQNATIIAWHRNNGDMVSKGEEIVELETTKAVYFVEAKDEGFLYYVAKIGEDLDVGHLLCVISKKELSEDELSKIFDIESVSPENREVANKKVITPSKVKIDALSASIDQVSKDQNIRFSKAALKLLKETGLSESTFAGRGLIKAKDVSDYIKKSKSSEKDKRHDKDPRELWVDKDVATVKPGLGLYSKEFIHRIIGGGYGDGQVSSKIKIITNIIWYLHFVPFLTVWILAKIPIISTWIEILARIYKRNFFGFFLRGAYYKSKLRKMGRDVIIDQNVEIWGCKNVSVGSGCHLDMYARIAAGEGAQGQHGDIQIGDYVHIGPQTQLAGRGGITIGSYTAITAGTKIFSASNVGNNPSDPADLLPMSHAAPIHRQRIVEAPVNIEDHVFVGLNVCVLPGVKIGKGAIVSSGAILTKNIPPFSIIKGAGMSISGTRVPKI